MFGLIIAIHILICLFLILIILIQPGKGYGLSETFGGTAQTIFGTRSATFVTRATSISAAIFLITCLALTVISGKRSRSIMERMRPEEVKKEAPLQTQKPVSSTASESAALPVNPPAPVESAPVSQ
jgi:preprotein translocase subunit SecG